MEIDSLPNGTAASPGPTLGPGPTAATPPPSSKLSHLADSLKLEHQFLRVPFEHYKKTIRANHRVVEKEISSVINGVSEAADRDNMSSDDAVNHLSSLVSRLQGLKRKLEEGSKTEHLQAQRCRARLDHLESADVESLSEWNNTRVNRILVDYMLRMSYYDMAVKLAESRNIQDFVDIDIFQEAKRVIEALQNKEVGPALAWCAENKSRLKKFKSKFEFQLRLQEFIELVRAENNLRAISYAQKYLAPWGTTHMKEFQRVFVTVAYKSTTECAAYKVLFEPKQWDYLVDQFKQEFCKLYGMTLEPLLNIFQVLFEYFILVELGTIQWRQFDRFCIRTLLGGKYMKKSESLQSQPSSTSSNVAMTEDDLIDEWMHFVEDSDEKVVGDEVDSYLFDPLVQITKEESTKYFNILLWWKVNGNKYPILAAIAKDILAIQVSTVASESAFSTGGRVISDFRSSLTPKSVEALICMQNWLRGDTIITLEDDAPSIDHIEFYESIESELAKSTSSIASLTLDQEPQQAPKQSQGSNSQEPPLMRLQSARSSQAQRPPKPAQL